MSTVTIALIGDPKTALGPSGELDIKGLRFPEDFEIPYADRPKLDLEVRNDETLGSIMARAAAGFEVAAPSWGGTPIDSVAFTAFYIPEHEEQFRGWHSELPLVNDRGQLYFDWRWQRVTYGEVRRAAEAGVFVGDPERPYLILQPGIGNGLLVDWQTLKVIWDSFYVLLEHLDTLGGVYATKKLVVDRLRDRFKRSAPVIEKHASDWDARSARPANVFNALGDGPWHREDLAERLACTPEEADAFIFGAGWSQDSQGLWRRGNDEEAQLLGDTMDLVIHVGMTAKRGAVEKLVLHRTKKFLETGKAPELDWEKVMRKLPDDGIGFRDPSKVEAPPEIGRLRKTWWRIRYRYRGP